MEIKPFDNPFSSASPPIEEPVSTTSPGEGAVVTITPFANPFENKLENGYVKPTENMAAFNKYKNQWKDKALLARAIAESSTRGIPFLKFGEQAYKNLKEQEKEQAAGFQQWKKTAGQPIADIATGKTQTALAEKYGTLGAEKMAAAGVNEYLAAGVGTIGATAAEILTDPALLIPMGAGSKGLKESKTVLEPFGGKLSALVAEKLPEGFRRFWSPLSTLPGTSKALYETERGRVFGKINQAEQTAVSLQKQLSKYDLPSREKLFEFLDKKTDIKNLPAELRPVGTALRNTLDSLGQELVNRKMMTPETFKEMKGRYVKYMYSRFVVGEKEFTGGGAGAKMGLDYLKQRQNLTAEQKEALGIIKDVAVSVPSSVGKTMADVAKYDFLDNVSRNADLVLPESMIEIGGKRVGVGTVQEEIKAFKTMKSELGLNATQVKRLDEYETALKRFEESSGQISKNFERIPVSKAWGNLSGAYVRKEVADDMRPYFEIGKDKGKTRAFIENLTSKSMEWFKLGAVPFNPPTASRNYVGAMNQAFMSGVNPLKYHYYQIQALGSFIKKDKNPLYKAAKELGLFRTNWSQHELNDALNMEIRVLKDAKKIGTLASVEKNVKRFASYYGKIDDLNKMTIFIDRVKKGMPYEQAAREAQKWGMDYSLVNPAVRTARKFFMPFVTYQYKSIPLVAEALLDRPLQMIALMAVPRLVTAYATDKLNVTEKEFNETLRMLPEYLRKAQSLSLVPWRGEDGKLRFVDMQYYNPWGWMLELGKNIGSGRIGDVANQIGFGNPILQAIETLKSGKGDQPPVDTWSGEEIWNRLDSGKEKFKKTMLWLGGLSIGGAWKPRGALDLTMRAIKQQRDKYGNIPSAGEAAGAWVGFRQYGPSAIKSAKETTWNINDVRGSLYKVLLDPKLSKEQKAGYIKRFKEKVESITRR